MSDCPLCGFDLWYDYRGALIFCTNHECDYSEEMETITESELEKRKLSRKRRALYWVLRLWWLWAAVLVFCVWVWCGANPPGG